MAELSVYENYASQLHIVLKKYSEIVAVPELEKTIKLVGKKKLLLTLNSYNLLRPTSTWAF